MFKNCEICNSFHNRKSLYCSNSCKNKAFYLSNKQIIAQKYQSNKEKILNYKKQFYSENKEVILKRSFEWKTKNIDKIRKYHRNRIYSLQEKLAINLRSRLSVAIKNEYKSGSAVSDLGCSIEEFKKHLESKFESWMNWDNYGKYSKEKKTWQIDHKIALAKFDLSNLEELKKACHYSNLQPMSSEENILKGTK